MYTVKNIVENYKNSEELFNDLVEVALVAEVGSIEKLVSAKEDSLLSETDEKPKSIKDLKIGLVCVYIDKNFEEKVFTTECSYLTFAGKAWDTTTEHMVVKSFKDYDSFLDTLEQAVFAKTEQRLIVDDDVIVKDYFNDLWVTE